MLHNVYIFRDDGVCLLARKYGSIETDEGLVSGFLSAISHFGQELGTNSLERLDFGDYRIILVGSGDDLITAGVIDKHDDVIEMEKTLNTLIYNLKNHYGDISNIVDRNALLNLKEFTDEILKYASSSKPIIGHATNLARVAKQMRTQFAIILEAIAEGKPIAVCAEQREDAEIYVHTLTTLRSKIDIIPWTEDEELIFSLKGRNKLLVGIPLRYLMKLAQDEELVLLNLTQFRVHGNLRPTKKWKDAARYAYKHVDELGEAAIYTLIRSLMESVTEP